MATCHAPYQADLKPFELNVTLRNDNSNVSVCVRSLADSGSGVTIIKSSLCEKLQLPMYPSSMILRAAGGHRLQVIGFVNLVVEISGCLPFGVTAQVVENLSYPFLLGFQDMRRNNLTLICSRASIRQANHVEVNSLQVQPVLASRGNSERIRGSRQSGFGSGFVTSKSNPSDFFSDANSQHNVLLTSFNNGGVCDMNPQMLRTGDEATNLRIQPMISKLVDSASQTDDVIRQCRASPTSPREKSRERGGGAMRKEHFWRTKHLQQRRIPCAARRAQWSTRQRCLRRNLSGRTVDPALSSSDLNQPAVSVLCEEQVTAPVSNVVVVDKEEVFSVQVDLTYQIKPFSGALIPISVAGCGGTGVVNPVDFSECELVVSEGFIDASGPAVIEVFNPLPCSVLVHRGTKLGEFEPVVYLNEVDICALEAARENESNSVERGQNCGESSSLNREQESLEFEVTKFFPDRVPANEREEKQDFHSAFDFEGCILKGKDLDTLKELLFKYKNIWSRDSLDVGRFKNFEYCIRLIDDLPVYRPQYKLSIEQKRLVHSYAMALLDKGIVQRTSSEYSSPILLIKKPNTRAYRLVNDLRGLNQKVKVFGFDVPTPQDLFDSLAGSTVFSSSDLSCGFWQVPLAPSCRHVTAFQDGYEKFCFAVLPMGIKVGSNVFQMAFESVLKGIEGRESFGIYIDDLLIKTPTIEQHFRQLEFLFRRLQEEGVKLRPDKFFCFRNSLRYLGFIIDRNGLRPDPKKVAPIKDLVPPSDLKTLKSFLAFASFYRRFFDGFANIVEPLVRLTRKGVSFVFGPEQREAFAKLKEMLTSDPVLVHPRFDRPFILNCDSSDFSVGACLCQLDDDGNERVVAYYSASMSMAERKNGIFFKELLACYSAVMKFRQYLLDREFTLRSDHSPLKAVGTLIHPSARVMRMISFLSEFEFKFELRKGCENSDADFVSRLHQSPPISLPKEPLVGEPPPPFEDSLGHLLCDSGSTGTTDVLVTQVLSNAEIKDVYDHSIPTPTYFKALVRDAFEEEEQTEISAVVAFDAGISDTEFCNWQREDETLRLLWRWCSRSMKPESLRVGHPMFSLAHAFNSGWIVIKEGILFYKNRVMVPEKIVPLILHLVHDCMGHFGIEKTIKRVATKYFWLNLDNDVQNWVRSCTTCQCRKAGKQPCAELKPMPVGLAPLSFLQIDHVTVPSNGEFQHILVMQDRGTRWCEAVPCKTVSAAESARIIFENWICRYSQPQFLHSDRGGAFTSQLFSELTQLFGIKHNFSSPFHSQTNGLVEKTNSVLVRVLSRYVQDRPDDWIKFLQPAVWAYRTAHHSSLGMSAYECLFGISPPDLTDIYFGDLRRKRIDSIGTARKAVHEIMPRVRVRLEQARDRMVSQYNKRVYDPPLNVGDEVVLYFPVLTPGIARKLQDKWSPGFRVNERVGEHNFVVTNGKFTTLVHRNRLKHVASREPRFRADPFSALPDRHCFQTPPFPRGSGGGGSHRLRNSGQLGITLIPRIQSHFADHSQNAREFDLGKGERDSRRPLVERVMPIPEVEVPVAVRPERTDGAVRDHIVAVPIARGDVGDLVVRRSGRVRRAPVRYPS